MAIERFWEEVGPFFLTKDGEQNGKITVEDTACFKVKAFIVLQSDTQQIQRFQIKRILNNTEIILGPEKKSILTRSDVSGFKISANAVIHQPEQEKVKLDQIDIDQATYEQEPTVARRSLLVDKYGSHYTSKNPFPVQINWEKILLLLNNANFLKLGNFDKVIPSFSGDLIILNYFEGNANIARATVRYVDEFDWDFELQSFINDTNGDILLDDDNTPLILE